MSHDGESSALIEAVRNYKLLTMGNQIYKGSSPFVVKGKPPIQ